MNSVSTYSSDAFVWTIISERNAMNLNEWNKTEIRVIIDEALGKDNRYFFWKKHGREAYNNDELIIYYILNGGAEKFAREHSNEKPDATDK